MCRPHAEAYDAGTWRWLPGAALREQLATAPPHEHTYAPPADDAEDGDVTMTDMTPSQSNQTEDGLEPLPVAETLVDDGISGDTKNPEIHFQPVRTRLRPPICLLSSGGSR